jgi:hypothetical protein
MGDKFFYGDSDIPVVKKNKYTINEGEPKFADMVSLITTPKKKRTEPMDNLGSLFGAETFEEFVSGFPQYNEGNLICQFCNADIETETAEIKCNSCGNTILEVDIDVRNYEAEESINPKDYIAISFLDQQGNGHPTTLLNSYDLRFGERGSTYFKALREALDEGVKRGDYEGYKIKKRTSKPLQDEDYVYERRYNDEYDYEVWLMGDKFFYGDSGIPVVKNKYTINEGEPKFADMVYLNVIPKEKTEQPMDGLGSLFGAETFEAKGIDTFTEPFDELKSGSILNKAILLGSLGAGAMIGLKLRK